MATSDPPVESAAPAGARRMVRTFAGLLGGELMTRATMLVAALIAVRVLAPGAFGAYTYAVALASIANFVIDLGIASLVTRDVSQDASRAPHLLGAFLKAQVLLAIATFAIVAALAVSGIVSGPASTDAILLATAAVAIASLARPFEATVTGLGRAELLTVTRALRGVSLVACTAVAATLWETPESLLGAMAVAETAGVVAAATISTAVVVRPALRARSRDLKRLLKAAIPFALLAGFNVIYLRVDTLMLGWLDSDVAVGNYGVASRIMETALVLPAYFGSAFLATVGQTGARTARARVQTQGAVRNVLLLTVPFAVALAYAADPLVRLAAGSGYDEAGTILTLLCPMLVLIASYGVLANLQVALDHVSLLVRILGVAVLLKIAINIVVIPAYGPKGAAIVASSVEACAVVVQWWFARDLVDVRPLLGFLGRVLAAGAVMAGVALGVGAVAPWPVAVVASGLAFAAAAVALRCVDASELRMVRAALGRPT
jgi:O-antigen/teichoic acid export membrane protein